MGSGGEVWASWFGLLASAACGLCVGSYANVVVYRSPRVSLSSLRPARSFCPACGTRLSWSDNIPLLSWLLLGRRCRSCDAAIHWRYPAIELLVGVLFVLAWMVHPPLDGPSMARLGVAWYLAATCVVVSAIDLEHRIIPDTITWPGMALGLLASCTVPGLHAGQLDFDPASPRTSGLLLALAGLLAGGGLLWIVGQVGNVLLRHKLKASGVPDAMGYGDVKWMALAGTFLGPYGALDAILLGCFSGAAIGVGLQVVARLRGRAVPAGIPFGPFLSLGILVELARPRLAWDLLSSLSGPA